MSILLRPGWAYRSVYHPADHQRMIIAEERAKNVVKQAEQLFLQALKKSGTSMEFLSGPHTEIYKFVGQIILNDPELAKYFPDIQKPYQLKSRHIARLATLDDENKGLQQLQSAINSTFTDIEKFTDVARSLHTIRRAKGLSEVDELEPDKREKIKQWAKKQDVKTSTDKVSTSDLSPEEQEHVAAASERLRPTGELANLMKALHGVRFPTSHERRMGERGPSLEELAEDHPDVAAFMNASNLDDAIEALATSDEPIARQVLQKIYEVLPESVRLNAKQVDSMLMEKARQARQYRCLMEERYGR